MWHLVVSIVSRAQKYLPCHEVVVTVAALAEDGGWEVSSREMKTGIEDGTQGYQRWYIRLERGKA